MEDYGSAHDISEVIRQADVTIKKLVRTCVIFGSEPKKSIAPNPPKKEKNMDTYPSKTKWHALFSRTKNVRSGPFS